MMLWPEMRSAYRTRTGLELAKQSLDVFVGFVLEYSINSSDYAHQKREAMMKMAEDMPIDGADFDAQAGNMMSQLDALENSFETRNSKKTSEIA